MKIIAKRQTQATISEFFLTLKLFDPRYKPDHTSQEREVEPTQFNSVNLDDIVGVNLFAFPKTKENEIQWYFTERELFDRKEDGKGLKMGVYKPIAIY